jgi:peptidoglycan hydrolase-like protein with peptidoglycan-binding domain
MGKGRVAVAGVVLAGLVTVAGVAAAATGVVSIGHLAGSDRPGPTVSAAAPPPVDERDPAPAGSDTPSPEPSTSATPDPERRTEPKPAPEPLLERGDQGRDVRELQARLKQLEWYLPDVSGRYDATTVKAVRGFQEKRRFEVTGAVDRRTWRRVVDMSRTPTNAELHNRLVPGPTILGPGDEGPQVRELQARLRQIAWFYGDVTDFYGDVTTEAVAGFQTKREIPSTGKVDQRTMDRLLAMTHEPTAGELANEEPDAADGAPLDPRCATGRALCIDKTSSSLRWVVDGDVLMSMDVRFGASYSPTREGLFHVGWKDADHVSNLYGSAMPFSMFFSGGQAVHYSSDFAARGYAGASHGCVNVRDYDALASLYDQVNVGDKVVVYWS